MKVTVQWIGAMRLANNNGLELTDILLSQGQKIVTVHSLFNIHLQSPEYIELKENQYIV